MIDLEQTEAKLRRWRDEGSHYKTYQVADDLISECRELRAELARVKAESLRVVPVGEAVEYWMTTGLCQYNTRICGKSGEIMGKHDIVQPVRLERWPP